jgi:hypothetical protein
MSKSVANGMFKHNYFHSIQFMKSGHLILRLTPIVLCVFGWYLAHWLGAIIGFVIGCPLALIIYYFLRKSQIQKRKLEISGLSDEQLKAIAVDPASRDLGHAIAELERRGIKNIRPSMESLFELLASPNTNRRALGYSYLSIMYPTAFAKIAKTDSSSSDAPEVWRERIAVFKETN